MAFADVIRKQRRSGSSVFSSLSTAAAETLKEKMDPRNLLNQKGVITALFPGLRSYATKKRESRKISTAPTLSNVNIESLDAMNEKLDFIGKNTMSLPIMMRDINVMRQSMIKLVKLQGGTQEDKADRFFRTAAEQEKLYENTLKTKKSTSTAPTKVNDKKDGGIFNLAFLGTLLLGGLAAYFTSPEFRKQVDDIIKSTTEAIFGEDGIFAKLVLGFTALIASIAILKGAFIAFEIFVTGLMAKLAAKVGLPVPGTQQTTPGAPDMDRDGKSKGKGKGKYGHIGDRPKTTMDKARELANRAGDSINARNIARMGAVGLLVGEAYMLYKLIESDSHETPSQADVEHGEIGGYTPEQGFTAEGGPVDTDKIKGLSQLPKNFQDPSNATAESKRLGNYKPTPVRAEGVALLEKVMDSEGITDPEVRGRIIALAQRESGLRHIEGPVINDPKSMHYGDSAQGILQVMPKTGAEMGFSLSDLKDPEKAALAGVRYFMKNYKKLGSLDAATVAHHAGPGKGQEFLETGTVTSKDVATGLRTMDYLAQVQANQTAISGGKIGSGTTALADARNEMSIAPPVIINNAPQTVNNMGGGSSGVVMASVVDEEFARLLFERAVI